VGRSAEARAELTGHVGVPELGIRVRYKLPPSQSEPALKASLAVLERRTRLTFVASAADGPPPAPGQLNVVLDVGWTPGPGDRPDVVSIRPWFAAALERHDLFSESLDLLDRWGATTGIADRLVVEGVTYWFRVREPLWHWLHERLLWRYALAAIEREGAFESIAAPATEEALIDVVRALGRPIEVPGEPDPEAESAAAHTTAAAASPIDPLRAAVRGVVRRLQPKPESPATAERRRREAMLDERLDRLATLPSPRIVVLTLPGSYQRIGGGTDVDRRDPNLGSLIPRLRQAGFEPIVMGIGMSRKRDEDWAAVEADDRLLPGYVLASRWGRPEDNTRGAAAASAVRASLDAMPAVPLELDGLDIGPAFAAQLRTSLERLIDSEVHQLARVERLIDELEPAALLMSQEGHRTPWLMAASRAGVPVFALQHGILYPTHPGYPDRRDPRLIVPSRTFVFGDYERRVLEAGAYHPGEVVVSGSPRLDLDATAGGGVDAAAAPDREAERRAVRAELGVADGDRMLVVSTVHTPFVRRSHLAHMLEVCLGGPLSRVHVIIKQHPGERDEGPYRDLLGGLARAGGYAPPPISVVREIDLYRLLRAADAHLGLHSTVITDAVMAGTDNLIARVEASGDLLGYVAAGVARPVTRVADLRAALDHPQPAHPAARRTFIEDHFRPGEASARIVEMIDAEVRELITASGSTS
jgi:hypothetical protein